MKLASLDNGTRDGCLVCVSNDLTRFVESGCDTLQAALDDWTGISPGLEERCRELDNGTIGGKPFDQTRALSPLPRAYQWADGSAYVTHVELVRKARGANMPGSYWTDPLIYQGGSDSFVPPRAGIELADESWGIDFEAEVAVITDDVPMGVTEEQAGGHIKLVMLVNDVSLRNLIASELAKGFGFFNSKPSSAFSPVAVSPDVLGHYWRNEKLHLPLLSFFNGKPFGHPDAGTDMTFSFARLIAHAARTRPLGAGTIIGSGTVSNRNYHQVGHSCIAERRMVETMTSGRPRTPFMRFGDTIRIEMKMPDGQSVFGAIEQTLTQKEKTR